MVRATAVGTLSGKYPVESGTSSNSEPPSPRTMQAAFSKFPTLGSEFPNPRLRRCSIDSFASMRRVRARAAVQVLDCRSSNPSVPRMARKSTSRANWAPAADFGSNSPAAQSPPNRSLPGNHHRSGPSAASQHEAWSDSSMRGEMQSRFFKEQARLNPCRHHQLGLSDRLAIHIAQDTATVDQEKTVA